jgi:hypothetical protein
MRRPTKANIREWIYRYDQANLECADLILADPGGYGGDGSLMVVWARLVIDRLNGQRKRISNDAIWKI